VPRRAFHADGNARGRFVPAPELGRAVQTPFARAGGGARGVIGDQHGRLAQILHEAERLDHPLLGVASGVRWKGLPLAEPALDVTQHFALAVVGRQDQGGMLSARHIELHAVEESQAWHGAAHCDQIRPGLFEVELRMMRAAMVGGDHPLEAETLRHAGIEQDRMQRVATDQGRGRRIRVCWVGFVPCAVDAVHVVVAGEPAAGAILFLRVGRRGEAQATENERRQFQAHC